MHVATGRNGRIGEWAKDTTKNTQHKMKTITKININNMCTWNSRIRIVNSLSLSSWLFSVTRSARSGTRSTKTDAVDTSERVSWRKLTEQMRSNSSRRESQVSLRLSALGWVRLGSPGLGSWERGACAREKTLREESNDSSLVSYRLGSRKNSQTQEKLSANRQN